MKNKGFTLVELIVTIAILALIATIAVVAVTQVRNNAESDIDEIQQNIISKAFDQYIAQKLIDNPNYSGGEFVTINDLKNAKLIKDTDSIDENTNYFVDSKLKYNEVTDIKQEFIYLAQSIAEKIKEQELLDDSKRDNNYKEWRTNYVWDIQEDLDKAKNGEDVWKAYTLWGYFSTKFNLYDLFGVDEKDVKLEFVTLDTSLNGYYKMYVYISPVVGGKYEDVVDQDLVDYIEEITGHGIDWYTDYDGSIEDEDGFIQNIADSACCGFEPFGDYWIIGDPIYGIRDTDGIVTTGHSNLSDCGIDNDTSQSSICQRKPTGYYKYSAVGKVKINLK